MLNIQAKLKNSFLLADDNAKLSMSRSISESVPNLKRASMKNLEKSKSLELPDESTEERKRLMLKTDIEKYTHLLVGKVRDTQMIFSFFIEASIIDVD